MIVRANPLAPLPTLDAQKVADLLGQALDLVFLLSPTWLVIDHYAAPKMHAEAGDEWIGAPLSRIVMEDSQRKLEQMLSAENLSDTAEPLWRHVNFVRRSRESLPLLVRIFPVRVSRNGKDGSVDDDVAFLLVARDLRPTIDLTRRYQRAHVEMENVLQEHFEKASRNEGADVRELAVQDMMRGLGERPLDHLVEQTARALERLCIIEAVRRCDGDLDRAAEYLSVNAVDLRRRMARSA